MHYPSADNPTTTIIRVNGARSGQRSLITLTGLVAVATATLEFCHGDDQTTWYAHPAHTNMAVTGGVLSFEVVCPSGAMRIKFDTVPGGKYWASCQCIVQESTL